MFRIDGYKHIAITLLLGGALAVALVLVPAPVVVNQEGWIDRLTEFVLIHNNSPHSGTFDPYVGQLVLVRHLFRRGDIPGTYVAMNRLMDMLEAREGNIRGQTADAIWDRCYQVTPPMYHDVSRHLKARAKAEQELWRSIESHGHPPMES
jgi:hypothetical protein